MAAQKPGAKAPSESRLRAERKDALLRARRAQRRFILGLRGVVR